MKKSMPLWHHQRQIPRGFIPPSMEAWLFDVASLTQRLRQVCQGRFQVQVMSQTRVRPLRDERCALGMRDHEYALVRMVYLLCDGQPWVFARTIIPLRTLSGAQRRLRRLGTKPLGEMLFADPSMRRSDVEVARLEPGSVLFNLATARVTVNLGQPPQAIWGRRSVFYLQHKPLLVGEIFLPELMSADTSHNHINEL